VIVLQKASSFTPSSTLKTSQNGPPVEVLCKIKIKESFISPVASQDEFWVLRCHFGSWALSLQDFAMKFTQFRRLNHVTTTSLCKTWSGVVVSETSCVLN